MAIENTCVNCGQRLKADDEYRGRSARCPICQTEYVVGEDAPAKSASPPRDTSDSQASRSDSLGEIPSTAGLEGGADVLTPVDAVGPSQVRANVPLESVDPAAFALEHGSHDSPIQAWYVQTPDQRVYGPGDAPTLMQWFEQKRVNDACYVRQGETGPWVPFGEWYQRKMQTSNHMEARGTPILPVSPYAANASDNPYASPVDDSRYTHAPGRPLPSSASNSQSRAGLILAFGILSLLLTGCGFGWIFAAVTLIIASQENVGRGGNKVIDGRVRIGQVLAVVAILLGAIQWLWFFSI